MHSLYTAVYRLYTRPCTGHVHGPSVAVFTTRVHGGVRSVYMAVYTAVHGVNGPCTPACNGRIHSASTAVYRVHLHGRVLCTRPCLRPMYMAVYRLCTRPSLRTVCTALYVPCTRPFTACTDRVHRRVRAVYMVRPRPCTGYTYTVGYSVHGLVYGPCTRPLTAVYRLERPCTDCVHGRARAMYMVRP